MKSKKDSIIPFPDESLLPGTLVVCGDSPHRFTLDIIVCHEQRQDDALVASLHPPVPDGMRWFNNEDAIYPNTPKRWYSVAGDPHTYLAVRGWITTDSIRSDAHVASSLHEQRTGFR